MQRKTVYILIALLLVVSGAAATFYFNYKRSYEVIHPVKGSLLEAVYGLGKVKSERHYEVIVGVISTIKHLHIREGSFVKKGLPLITFDSGAVFRAPFSGTVTVANLQEGATALPGVAIMRIEDLSDLYIEVALEQQAIARVRAGQKVKILFESLRGDSIEGTVTAVFPKDDEFLTHISFPPQKDLNILPGMSADTSIEIGKIEDALMIPLKAIQNGMVSVKRDGKWKKLKVEIDHIDGLFGEVKGNLLTTNDEIQIKKTN